MFQKLFTSHAKPRSTVTNQADDVEYISSHDQIAALLNNMLEQHVLLSIYPEGSKSASLTAVIKVSPEQNTFLLDGVKAKAAHLSLCTLKQFYATTRLNGINTSFTTTINSVAEHDGMPYYQVNFPERVMHEQKRQFFRASMPLDELIPVSIKNCEGLQLQGELRNLSVGGLCTAINAKQHPHLEKDILLTECAIQLDTDHRIITQIEVCYLRPQPRGIVSYLGARFIELDKITRRSIQKLVGQMDRKSTKNRQRTSP